MRNKKNLYSPSKISIKKQEMYIGHFYLGLF